MKLPGHLLALAVGTGVGVAAAAVVLTPPKPAKAAASDRYQDFVMCTGAVSLNPRAQSDGVWLLDYKAGKLLGTVIDKGQGKIVGWAEVDLVGEFEIVPRADVHFVMCTGFITQGQAALYVAETTTGKFGVYTMGPGQSGNGIVIRRHDLTTFRKTVDAAAPQPPQPAVPPMGTGLPPQPAGVPVGAGPLVAPPK